MNTKRPTTLRQMQRKIQAEKDAADLKRWIREHPYSPEAREAAEEARIAALRKFEARMETEKRREARLDRKERRDGRVSHAWLKETFELSLATPGGLKRREGHLDGGVNEVRTTGGTRWRVFRHYKNHTSTMWAKQAIAILSKL